MPPGLARCDIRLTKGIQERRLAVIDMAHHGHDRCARRQIAFFVVVDAFEADLDIAVRDPLHGMPELADHHFRGIGIHHLIDRGHHSHFHQ